MATQRVERLREELKREISGVIRKMKDPRIGFVSVTDVELSGDLRHAKVYVSVYGSEEERQAALSGLQNAQGFVRTELGRRIRLRHTPEVQFRFDPSIERGARVHELLRQVRGERPAGEADGDGGLEGDGL